MIIIYSGKYPSFSAGAKRIELYSQGLEQCGASVRVLTTFRESKSRVRFYFNLLTSSLVLAKQLLFALKKKEAVFAYGYGWISLLLIRVITWLYQSKFIYEINEKPYSYYTSKVGEIPGVKLFHYSIFRYFVLPLIDGFVVISSALVDYLISTGIRKSKIIIVPILVNPDARTALSSNSNINIKEPFLLHAGALSEQKDGIIGVFKALALVNCQVVNKLHFYLTDRVAPSNVLSEINRIVSENKLDDFIHFTGPLHESDLIEMQKRCSMLILNKPDNEQNRYNFPTKLGEYLRLSKPVVFTKVGEMNKFLKDGVNGFAVNADDPQNLSNVILKVLEGSDLITKIGENGRLLAENEFNFKSNCERLYKFFQDV